MTSRLSKLQRDHLVRCVQYLNLGEMRTFCRAHDLPLYIHLERRDGSLRRTGDRDRKDVVLDRIVRFALDGTRLGPTIYAAAVASEAPLPDLLTRRTRLHYGQYDKRNERFVELMKELTDGAFETGMIARLVLREFWTAGEVPTLSQFADAWLRATEAHTQPRPEGAYLVHLHEGRARSKWKQSRARNASEALAILRRLVPEESGSE